MRTKQWICLLLTVCLTLAVTGCGQNDTSSNPSSVGGTTSGTTTTTTTPSQSIGFINQDIAPGAIRITADPDITHQTVEYFGASGCWVGGVVDKLPEAKLDECMDLLYDKEKGIGLTSYRYNIGGGEPIRQSWDAYMKRTKCLETAPGQYDLNNDAVAISVLRKAVERGANVVTLFANSPPARMTVSGYTSGELSGLCNLHPDYVDDFATYLVDIADLLVDSGIPVTYISPINEPQHDWGNIKVNRDQEGCRYNADQALELGRAVATELNKRNASYKLSLVESAYWDGFGSSLFKQIVNDDLLLSVMDSFSGHSYGDHITAISKASFTNVIASAQATANTNLSLRQTEWCTGNSGSQGAVDMSRAIYEDLMFLGCSSWEFWVNMMTDDWSLIRVNGTSYTPSVRMWALGNYSKFVTGHTVIESEAVGGNDDVFSVGFVSPDGKTTTLVVTNSTMQKKTISFTGTPFEGKTARVYETSLLKNLQDCGVMSTDYGYDLTFQSVTTFVFENK